MLAWIPMIFAGLFLVGAILNTWGPEPDITEATAGYAIALCLFEIGRLYRRNQRQMQEFVAWMIENLDAVWEGTAEYRGATVGPETVVTQYQMAISLLFASWKAPSRFYLVGEERTFFPALYYTVSSLVLGWWGLPHGPIFTIGAVVTNLRGGKRQRVGDLIDKLVREPEAAEERESALEER